MDATNSRHIPAVIKRPALGQAATFGTLYDAQTDSFLPLSIFRANYPASAVSSIEVPTSDIRYSSHESYSEKFKQLDVGADLGASFLAGLFSVDGSGHYLRARKGSEIVAQKSLLYDIKTVTERMNYQDVHLKDVLAVDTLATSRATHVVAEIQWGSRNIVSIKQHISNVDHISEVKASLQAKFDMLEPSAKGRPNLDHGRGKESSSDDIEISVFGDVIPDDGLFPQDFASASAYLSKVPAYVSRANNGKGKPLMYTLLPISQVAQTWKQAISQETVLHRLSNIQDYLDLLQNNDRFIPPPHVQLVQDNIASVRQVEIELQAEYATKLQQVRSGQAGESVLWSVLKKYRSELRNLGPRHPEKANYYREKIALLTDLCAGGAIYVGFNGASFEHELARAPTADVYVLDFSAEAELQSRLWQKHVMHIYSLVKESDSSYCIILRDWNAFGKALETPRLSLLRHGNIHVEDVVNDNLQRDNKCLALCPIQHVNQTGVPKPMARILVDIPCPAPRCSRKDRFQWQCAICDSYIEYGHVDEYIYCDCGRSHFQHWTFRCNSTKHVSDFASFTPDRLRTLLTSLEPFKELNILILGRTGVGKSTFINALINYLSHASLDAAISAEKLEWVVPFSFSTHYADNDGEFQDVKVKWGFGASTDPKGAASNDLNERDGAEGSSATQHTMVHRVQVGNLLIRLIDTPGIGDTGGAQKDAENMSDILSVLQNYQTLHGILVLLKPNETRLDTMFEFCVKELLANLHRDAAQNLAFGFTNTRGTNYAPGDTFSPLRTLLNNFKAVQIPLRKHNVFCFDSESFRYLAALKQFNIELDHRSQNSASWDYSVKESTRLIEYFENLTPHKVTSTVNLYQTRQRIIDLAEPMAKIAEIIQANIKVIEDRIAMLASVESQGSELKKSLDMKVKELGTVATDRPRTVCSETSCVEHSSTGVLGRDGKTVYDTIYKSLCHAPCYLDGVRLRSRGEPALRGCAAIGGDGKCLRCGHAWSSHLHIDYEYRDVERIIRNPQTEALLKRNASDAELKRAMIKDRENLGKELAQELATIRDAAARFSIFLKNNSIIPYNDATLAYVERQIEEEESKIQLAGGSRDKLENLKQFEKQYRQKIAILDEQMKKGEDQALLTQAEAQKLLQDLYALKHNGKQLRVAEDVIKSLPNTMYREHLYVLRRTPRHGPQPPVSTGGSWRDHLPWRRGKVEA